MIRVDASALVFYLDVSEVKFHSKEAERCFRRSDGRILHVSLCAGLEPDRRDERVKECK